jgi:beta-mannosidase
MEVITSRIEDGWEVAERSPGRVGSALHRTPGDKNWIPASVPGHVHLDLLRAGVIGDPDFRLQERGCQWVDQTDWTYRTTFSVSEERLAARGEAGRHLLHFAGLDTICRVFLNDVLIGTSENFFVPHRFDVTETLRAGDNALRIEFDSAWRVGQARAEEYLGDGTSERGRQHYFNFAARAFVRKPQYMFGWDWGPELISCGVWGEVDLVTIPRAEITDWRYDYRFTSESTVDIDVHVTVTKVDDAPVVIGAVLFAAGDTTPSTLLKAGPGTHTVVLPIRDFRVDRWTPNDGADNAASQMHKRYLLNMRLLAPDVFDEDDRPLQLQFRGETVGFRAIELVRQPDADGQGESFKFRVNGVDTFIKGANWIPDGNFPAAITEARLRERLTQARDAGFNMLRVWGGGLYETETFYRLCDELGLMVWQDFPLACSMYPDDLQWFVDAVRAEVVAAVRRLRNHPSLALWCGGNENAELAADRWAGAAQATRYFGQKLTDEVFPSVLAEEDGRTAYIPNSPYFGPHPQSEDYGDSHYWNVWHSKKPGSSGDWTNYAESRSRFSSEFGFAAPCGWAAWESCSVPEDWQPRSIVAQAHDKTGKGYETYLGYIERHYPRIASFDDLIYYGQANQADALTFGIEHWRRMKGRCWGTLYWQINDSWPTQSWATIDSAGDLRGAHYAARRFYAPLLLSLERPDAGVAAAHLVNDTLAAVPGTLTLRARTFAGEELAWAAAQTVAPANAASGAVLALPLGDAVLARAGEAFVHAVFSDSAGAVLAEKVMLLAEPKELSLPAAGLRAEITEASGDGTAILAVSARAFAWYVWLRLDGLSDPVPAFSDNWFHLTPGESRTITITRLPAGLPLDVLREMLRVRCLGGA